MGGQIPLLVAKGGRGKIFWGEELTGVTFCLICNRHNRLHSKPLKVWVHRKSFPETFRRNALGIWIALGRIRIATLVYRVRRTQTGSSSALHSESGFQRGSLGFTLNGGGWPPQQNGKRHSLLHRSNRPHGIKMQHTPYGKRIACGGFSRVPCPACHLLGLCLTDSRWGDKPPLSQPYHFILGVCACKIYALLYQNE